DLPDEVTRAAILTARLTGRPVKRDIDLAEIAKRTHGKTAASLASACELAALAAFRESIGTGRVVRIGTNHLLDALVEGAGEDRPTVERWSWKSLVLPEATLAELRQL